MARINLVLASNLPQSGTLSSVTAGSCAVRELPVNMILKSDGSEADFLNEALDQVDDSVFANETQDSANVGGEGELPASLNQDRNESGDDDSSQESLLESEVSSSSASQTLNKAMDAMSEMCAKFW